MQPEVMLVSLSSPIICGIFLWYVKRYFEKNDRLNQELEKARVKNNVLLLRGVSASLALGEATAEALETKTCNGEMKKARENAANVKQEIETFTCLQSSKHVS